MASIPAETAPANTFDASRWLADWSDNGGVVLLVHDHLYLRRSPSLDRAAAFNLDRLRDSMLRSGGGPAIAHVLMQRRNGDVP